MGVGLQTNHHAPVVLRVSTYSLLAGHHPCLAAVALLAALLAVLSLRPPRYYWCLKHWEKRHGAAMSAAELYIPQQQQQRTVQLVHQWPASRWKSRLLLHKAL
jgi:hypothetical protein